MMGSYKAEVKFKSGNSKKLFLKVRRSEPSASIDFADCIMFSLDCRAGIEGLTDDVKYKSKYLQETGEQFEKHGIKSLYGAGEIGIISAPMYIKQMRLSLYAMGFLQEAYEKGISPPDAQKMLSSEPVFQKILKSPPFE